MEDESANVDPEYTVEKIVDHARFDDMYFRKLMFLKSQHPATDQIMGNFVAVFKKGDLCSKFVYRTRWEGYRPEEDTWEPENNFFTIDDKGKMVANECLVEYKKLHGIKGNQTFQVKFAGQADLVTLEMFGLPGKVYTELNNRFEKWVQEMSKNGTLNEPDLNANAVFMTQPPSQLGEDKNAEAVDNLGVDFDEPETSAAGRLRELQTKEAKATPRKRASEEVSTDSLASSTDQQKTGKRSKKAKKAKLLKDDESDGDTTQPSFYWERPAQERYYEIKARQTKENESSWRKLCALTDSSSSEEELPRRRKPLEYKLEKLKAGLASSSSNGKGGDGKSADGIIYVGTHPATRPNEKKNNQKKVDQAYKNGNDEYIGLMGEMETGPSIGVQQKKNELTSPGIPTNYPPQKKPIKAKFDIDPLEKILNVMGAEQNSTLRNESEPKIQNRRSSSVKLPQNWSQRRKTILLDALPQDPHVQESQLKKQPPPRVPTEKEKVMAEKPKAESASLPKENDPLIVEEKPSVKKNVIKKGPQAQAVHGYFQFLMPPFLAMPYKRRRARSCAGAMTDSGASFEKEIDEEAAKEHRWNELMERGNEKPSEVVQSKMRRSIRMTQILRDGVVRYSCAEKGDRQHLRTIGHVISQPVPLREIDMELVEENKKNEAKRKKERLPRNKPDLLTC